MSYSGAVGAAVAIAWVLAGLLPVLAVVSMLAARGRLRRNHLVGIRLPPLYASDDAWRRGHAAAVGPSWTGFAVALVADLVGILEPVTYWVAVAAFVVTVVWAILAAIRAARTVTARSDAAGSPD